MTHAQAQALVDLEPLDWPSDRRAAAMATATAAAQRVADAATQLTPDDHAAAFAAWCDQHAAADAEPGGAR